jgi:hypothetical protein
MEQPFESMAARRQQHDSRSTSDGIDYQPIFKPALLGGLALPDRIVIAPMSRHLANADGTSTNRIVDY